LKDSRVQFASKERIWQILSDFPGYPDWNPFIIKIIRRPENRNHIGCHHGNPGQETNPIQAGNLVCDPRGEFCWRGKLFMKGLFDGTHYFILKETEDGKTHFIHGENFMGLLVRPILRSIETATL